MDEYKMKDEHFKKYDALAKKIGIEKLVKLMPVSKAEMVRKLAEDKHLNNIPLRVWDRQAGCYDSRHTRHFTMHFLDPWAPEKANGLSLAERVCVLKHVAKYYYAYK